jgi:hypothetical protein
MFNVPAFLILALICAFTPAVIILLAIAKDYLWPK